MISFTLSFELSPSLDLVSLSLSQSHNSFSSFPCLILIKILPRLLVFLTDFPMSSQYDDKVGSAFITTARKTSRIYNHHTKVHITLSPNYEANSISGTGKWCWATRRRDHHPNFPALLQMCHIVSLLIWYFHVVLGWEDLDLDIENLDLGLDVVNLIKHACESSNLPLAQ